MFPTPTQPRSRRQEPEAHTPAAAYPEPVIPAKGLGCQPGRLRCLQKEQTDSRGIRAATRVRPGQVTRTQPWQPRTSPLSDAGLAVVLVGALSCPPAHGMQRAPPPVHPFNRDPALSQQAGAFHATNCPRAERCSKAGQQDERPERSLALLCPTWATLDRVTSALWAEFLHR